MKLISMTDYCQEVSSEFMSPKKPFDKNYWFGKILKYSDFLKQPIELCMFVPCDKDGNVLEEPTHYGKSIETMRELLKEYKQAKERCLFKGFEIIHKDKHRITIDCDFLELDFNLIKNKFENHKTTEDLVKYNLQLTPTAQKLIVL